MLFLKSGITGFTEVDPDEVRRRYGVGPELVPDFIALRGDPSDGAPRARRGSGRRPRPISWIGTGRSTEPLPARTASGRRWLLR